VDFVRLILGHLTGTECRRAVARGWLLIVRGLVGGLLASVLLFLLWTWWLSVRYDPTFVPAFELRIVFSAVTLVLLTIVVVEAPAVLAGSLAGERERGILHLLLSTAVSPREIVEGRLLGKLSQVGMIVLAGFPMLAFLAPWDGMGFADVGTIALLLLATGVGGGGLAVGASILSRRGRDALLAVYILMMVLILSPMLVWLGLPREAGELLESFNPYSSMNRLVWDGDTAPALRASGLWMLLGLAGTGAAIWRLRPSCQPPVTVKKSRRRRATPAVDERPMLWKELYIERAASLGRLGRWLGVLITITIGGGSVVLGGVLVWSVFVHPEEASATWASDMLRLALGGFAGTFLGWLLQWGVGLRAAVSIASERERATWDALLMSPLLPSEIGLGKLFGSLYALRWMACAMVLAFTLAVTVEAISVHAYVTWIAGTAVACALMAAIGVRLSLSLPTATKAMTWTVGCWLAGHAIVAFCAFSIIAIVMTITLGIWAFATQYQLIPPNTAPWFPMSWANGWPLTVDLVTLFFTVLVVVDTSLRFDRIAGRMAGGALATRVDAWIHGDLREPVLLEERNAGPAELAFEPASEQPALETAADAVAVD
jgi:ABC-type transport system involved in multi-copper enzyme maturation permease subunit